MENKLKEKIERGGEQCVQMTSATQVRDKGRSEQEEGSRGPQRQMEFHPFDTLFSLIQPISSVSHKFHPLLFLLKASSFFVSHKLNPCTH
jgi:hypothetical protein